MSSGGQGQQSFQPYGQQQQNPWQRSQYGQNGSQFGNKMGYQGQNPAAFYDPMKGPQSTVQNQQLQTGGFNPMMGGGYGRGYMPGMSKPGVETGGMDPAQNGSGVAPYTLGMGAPTYAQNPNDPNALDLTGFGGMTKPGMQTGGMDPAVTGNSPIAGMGSAAFNDPNLPMMYRQQMQQKGLNFGPPQSGGFGTYGTPPNGAAGPFPGAWGQQDTSFNPQSMAGKQVQPNQAWYYGVDSIGRNIGNNGQAYPSFSGPADGFARTRGYFGG